MPKVLEDLVEKIIKQGKDKSSAYAIATKILQDKGVLKPGTQELAEELVTFEQFNLNEADLKADSVGANEAAFQAAVDKLIAAGKKSDEARLIASKQFTSMGTYNPVTKQMTWKK